MSGRKLYLTLFTMAAAIAAACLGVAYVTLSVIGDKAALSIGFAFIVALVIASGVSITVRIYCKLATDAQQSRIA